MMRTLLILLLVVSCAAFALDNSVTVHNLTASEQTNRVAVVSRLFAEGEIAACVQAYVAGDAIPTQTDVKSRWPDGTLKHAIVAVEIASISASGSVQVDFRNSVSCNSPGGAMSYAAIQALSWDGQFEATLNSITYTRNAKTMLTACGSISSDPFNSQCRYWLSGSLVTQIIIEDRSTSRTQDFGWQWDGDSWEENLAFKTIHPIFVVTISNPSGGGPFIHVETIAENPWVDYSQRQPYTFVIKTGAALDTVFTRAAAWPHLGGASWSVRRWSGTVPGGCTSDNDKNACIYIDYNSEYLIYSKAAPSYDLRWNNAARASTINVNSNDWLINTEGELEPAFCPPTNPRCGRMTKAWPPAGGQHFIGLNHVWDVFQLLAMDNTSLTLAQRKLMWERLFVGTALGMGGVPMHTRESLTDRCHNESGASKLFSSEGCDLNAFGFPLSVNARPTSADAQASLVGCTTGQPCLNSTSPDNNAWVTAGNTSRAHQPQPTYNTYLLTGDWYFLEDVKMWASYIVSASPYGTGHNSRHDDWGFINHAGEGNDRFWTIRELYNAVFIIPDDDPTAPYYRQKMAKNLAIREGMFCITDGTYYDPATTSPWYWGKYTYGYGLCNPLALWPFEFANQGGDGVPLAGAGGPIRSERHYYFSHRDVVYGRMAEVIPESVPLVRFVQQARVASILEGPAPFRLNYNYPLMPSGTFPTVYTSWADWYDDILKVATVRDAITSATQTTIWLKLPDTVGKLQGTYTGDQIHGLIKIDDERIRICNLVTQGPGGGPSGGLYNMQLTVGNDGCPSVTGRGFQGTTATTHAVDATATSIPAIWNSGTDTRGGYDYFLTGTLAMAAHPDNPNSYRAWEWARANQKNVAGFATGPLWSFTPRDFITNIRQIGSAVLFVAPQPAACGYAFNPTSSLDSGDTSTGTGKRNRSISVSGHTGETLRITCGTARTSVVVQ